MKMTEVKVLEIKKKKTNDSLTLRIKNEILRLEPRLWNKMCYLLEEALKDFPGDEILIESKGIDLKLTRLVP